MVRSLSSNCVNWFTFLLVLLGVTVSSHVFAQAAACNALKNYAISSASFTISSAEYFINKKTANSSFGAEQNLPPHCHVAGELDKRIGSDGKPYALKFQINLPDNWSGRYLFQGGGGLNGSVHEPMGAEVSGNNSALQRGFAVVSTDSGHEGQIFDASFMQDQEAALNFFFLGNMRVALATKPIVEAYYKKAIDKSYFVGCSTGGREGMIMAQRYPYLFNGIISGSPAIRTGLSNLALRWLNVQMNQAAKNGASGLPLPTDELKIVTNGILQACDSLDGAKDGLIFNMAACHFDPMTIACSKTKKTQCLAPEKAQALIKAVSGPKDSRGNQVYSNFAYDAGWGDNMGYARGLLAGGGTPPVAPSVAHMMTLDVDAGFNEATDLDRAIGDATSKNVSSFIAHGGKQIFYHGMSDPWFSAMDTLNYYKAMAQANGGLEKTRDFSRIFLVPGMGHCSGGEKTLDNFDMLTALVDWVENNKAPQEVIATGHSMPNISRPLCPFPQHSQYSGKGDINNAENYACQL